MSKIYLDSYFSELMLGVDHVPIHDYCQFNNTNWLQSLPNDCKVVGVSFYTNRYYEYIDLIRTILPRTQKLVINLSEPTDTSVLEFVKALEHPKIIFYSDVIVNEEMPANFKTNISWFVGPSNYYTKHDWAKELLSRILVPRSWFPRPYIYDCLLGQQREHRNIIENYYNECNFKNKFIYSYYKDNIKKGRWDNITHNDINVAVSETQSVSRYAILPYDIYNQSYLSIVAETTASDRYSQFTEKIAKPILARRPFVVFCGQYYLRNLRLLGFKTFGDLLDIAGCPIIDESYDSVNDKSQRWAAAWNEIERLKNADYDLLYAQVQHILDHNLAHFLCTDWQVEIKKEFI